MDTKKISRWFYDNLIGFSMIMFLIGFYTRIDQLYIQNDFSDIFSTMPGHGIVHVPTMILCLLSFAALALSKNFSSFIDYLVAKVFDLINPRNEE